MTGSFTAADSLILRSLHRELLSGDTFSLCIPVGTTAPHEWMLDGESHF